MTRGTQPAALGTTDSSWTTVGQVTSSHDGQLTLTPVGVSVVRDARARLENRRSPGGDGRVYQFVQQSCTSRSAAAKLSAPQRVTRR